MEDITLFVGNYASDDEAGIRLLTCQGADEHWILGPAINGARNASYGAYNPWNDVHYIVDEQDEGRLVTYGPASEKPLHCLASVPTAGAAPCFVFIDPEHPRVAVTNYKSGSIALYHISAETGLILEPPSVYQHRGRGSHPQRQDGPHIHCARFHGDRLYVTDLGTDEVLVFNLSLDEAILGAPLSACKLPDGQGPRHIEFHPTLPVAYVLTELGSALFVFSISPDGRLQECQRLSTLLEGFSGESLGGHLALHSSGHRLYVTNRGHDSFAVFSVESDGLLSLRQIAPTHGQSPRHFILLEEANRVVVAHQNGNSVVVLVLNDDGTIGVPVETIALSQPCFIGRLP